MAHKLAETGSRLVLSRIGSTLLCRAGSPAGLWLPPPGSSLPKQEATPEPQHPCRPQEATMVRKPLHLLQPEPPEWTLEPTPGNSWPAIAFNTQSQWWDPAKLNVRDHASSEKNRSKGCVSLLPSKPHASEWLNGAHFQNPSCKVGVWEIQFSFPSLCSMEGVLEGGWNKCQTSVHCVCYTSNSYNAENMVFWKKLIYKLNTRENSFFWTKNKCAFWSGQIRKAGLSQQEFIGIEVNTQRSRGWEFFHFLYPSNRGISKGQYTVTVYVIYGAW